MKSRKVPVVAAALAATLMLSACGGTTGAAEPDASAEPTGIAQLTGEARTSAIYEEAKKEGTVVWYTQMIPEQLAEPMKIAFEKEYPGVTLEYTRSGGQESTIKMTNEAQAGSPYSDVWDGQPAEELKAIDGAEKYDFPTADQISDDLKDPDGTWASISKYVFGAAYNTDQVSEADAPKTFEDLLGPRWRGKMAWTTDPYSGRNFIGNVLEYMGEDDGMEYLNKLSKQEIAVEQVSSRQLQNLVIAGQYSIALQVFNTHTAISAAEGAPIAFSALDVATVLANPGGLTANRPHKYAGMLFLDYMLSPKGQEVFRDAGYVPASTEILTTDPSIDPVRAGYETNVISPAEMKSDGGKWQQIFDDLFMS